MREHTEQLQRYNDNAPTVERVMELESKIQELEETINQLKGQDAK